MSALKRIENSQAIVSALERIEERKGRAKRDLYWAFIRAFVRAFRDVLSTAGASCARRIACLDALEENLKAKIANELLSNTELNEDLKAEIANALLSNTKINEYFNNFPVEVIPRTPIDGNADDVASHLAHEIAASVLIEQ